MKYEMVIEAEGDEELQMKIYQDALKYIIELCSVEGDVDEKGCCLSEGFH